MLRELLISLLDDDHGITVAAYQLAVQFAESLNEDIEDITSIVRETEGRVYLAEDWAEATGNIRR
jgi:K+-sensing histidine kinase KdpD